MLVMDIEQLEESLTIKVVDYHELSPLVVKFGVAVKTAVIHIK